jgi:uncharacterized PurR-regulated membrane protein YhhQ (DUF165 family)
MKTLFFFYLPFLCFVTHRTAHHYQTEQIGYAIWMSFLMGIASTSIVFWVFVVMPGTKRNKETLEWIDKIEERVKKL